MLLRYCLPLSSCPRARTRGRSRSGAPVMARSTAVLRRFRTRLPEAIPLIGVGGISSADDGLRMLDAGAALLQLYTGFIYGGPPLLTALNKAVGAASR